LTNDKEIIEFISIVHKSIKDETLESRNYKLKHIVYI